jgi:citrate lyase beta subunit
MMLGSAEHVTLVHEVFTPTDAEISYWRELDELAAEAERTGSGPIVHGDPRQGEAHVVHIAHVGSARKNLAWARDLGVID